MLYRIQHSASLVTYCPIHSSINMDSHVRCSAGSFNTGQIKHVLRTDRPDHLEIHEWKDHSCISLNCAPGKGEEDLKILHEAVLAYAYTRASAAAKQ